MAINFNPNLPPNDSLPPHEIKERMRNKNFELHYLAQKAYEVTGCPESIAMRAATAQVVTRPYDLTKTQAKKRRRALADAEIWHKARRFKHVTFENLDCEET